MKIIEMLKSFWKDEEGLSMVEYALVGALVAVVAIAGFTQLGGAVSGKASLLATSITNAGG
ncbi:MAG: Flp/Fap pilin component [Pseudomonadota bacterium]|jgi:pilus assembly protein Flp/PilA